jgi:Zn-dependent protease
MSWSLQIGRVAGIPIRLHVTFLLLMGWIAYVGFAARDPRTTFVALGLFGCVLLHELGHALTARRFGVQVVDITLLPIGGLARMAALPREWRQEFWIAVAGPVVSLALGGLFHAAHLAFEPHPGRLVVLQSGAFFLEQLAALNLILANFNMLPAFPLDGGRILRAVLASRMPYARATRTAAQVGQFMAFAVGFLGLVSSDPWLVVVAFFVFMGASEEAARVQSEPLAEGVPVREATVIDFQTLCRADHVGHAADLLLAGAQQDFLVVEDGGVVGLLTRRRLLEALAQAGREPQVGEVMEAAPAPVGPDTPLQDALERMSVEGVTVLPVLADGGLYGLLTSEHSIGYLLVRTARSGRSDRGTG